MKIANSILLALSLMTALAGEGRAAVKLTALQITSTDASGNIQGVGAHRFRTTSHGGHPCLFIVKGSDLEGAIVNGPNSAKNGIDIPMSVGTHTYTVLVEKANSYTWTNYTMQFHFDYSMNAQISVLAPMNTVSKDFFPPFAANREQVEDLNFRRVNSPGTLVYKSGQTEVKLTGYHFSLPQVFEIDRVTSQEVRKNNIYDYVGEFTLEVTAPPQIAAGGVVNGASFAAKVAPGSLFSIFGTDLASTNVSAANVPLPRDLAGTRVTVGGKEAPLVFVSATQINAQVPYEVVESAAVPVVVTVNGVSSLVANVAVVAAAPGIFQFGNKRAVMQNEDYTVNTADNPAAPGSYGVVYLTGSGQLDHAVATGAAAKAEPISRPRMAVTATLNGVAVDIAFGGLTPNFIGLMQVNLKIPNVPAGTYPLVVTMNGEKSNAAMVTVK